MISVQNHQQQLSGNKNLKQNTILKSCLGIAYSTLSIRLFKRPNSSIKVFYFLLFVFYFFSACSPKTAPVKKVPVPETKVEEKATEKVGGEQQKEEVKPAEKVKEKPEMIISLILPFELNNINYKTATSADLRKAEIAIDFYQGFKMGLDSVAKKGNSVNYRLQVFDSNDSPAALGNLASKGAIKASDLIVGPVFPNGIKAFSAYSKNMKMPMVSPLAATDPETFNNPYLITVNNSIDQHAYTAVKFIKKDLRPKKILLIRSGQADEYKYAVPFKKGMDSLAKGQLVSEIGIKAVGYENVYKSLNPTGLNVVVLPATDRVFLLTILKELEKLSSTYQIAVVGHPAWEKLTFLDFQQLERLNTYTTSAYQINYQSFEITDFVKYYRYKFSVEPTEYAFKGFDIAYYFGMLMNNKQHDFMKVIDTSFNGLHNDFNFIHNSKFGYYNTSLMMVKYENSQLRKVY